ncbi:MAG: hypothetical protein AAF483_17740 [Planctomycetota bacterium]
MRTGFQSFQLNRIARGGVFVLFLLALLPQLGFAQTREGTSSRNARADAVRYIPYSRLKSSVSEKIDGVVKNPSFFRRMPTEQIDCDPDMFTFMVRRPEVMVNIWQVMDITKVTARRLNDYSFIGNDGAGTICRCDLVFATKNLHVYYGEGSYDGSLAPRKVTGSCVCILRTKSTTGSAGENLVSGTMDVFLKFDNFGADLLARGVAPFIGKTTDYNFVETAKFIGQISQVCELSPGGARNLANKLTGIQPETRSEFAKIATTIATRSRRSEAAMYSQRVNTGIRPGMSLARRQLGASAGAEQTTAMAQSSSDGHRAPIASPAELKNISPTHLRLSDSTMDELPSVSEDLGMSNEPKSKLSALDLSPGSPELNSETSELESQEKIAGLSESGEAASPSDAVLQQAKVKPLKPQIFMRR